MLFLINLRWLKKENVYHSVDRAERLDVVNRSTSAFNLMTRCFASLVAVYANEEQEVCRDAV